MKKIYLSILYYIIAKLLAAQPMDATTQMCKFVDNINIFNHLYPQEKVFLHCDNTAYFQGDTIWFKAYIVASNNLKAADLSKILYIELLSEEGEVVSTQKLKIENGLCHGQIALVREFRSNEIVQKKKYDYFKRNAKTKNYYISLPSGYYEVRAYTHAMLNWRHENYFSRVFPVFDSPEKEGDYSSLTMKKKERKRINDIKNRPKTKKRKNINIDFYPEGGYLIQNITCRMAFKVTDKDGRYLSVNGYLGNNEKEYIIPVNTFHEGMGSFDFIPRKNLKYKLHFSIKGKDYSFDLPQAQFSEYGLAVKTISDSIAALTIHSDSDTSITDTLGVSIMCRNKLLHFRTMEISTPSLEMHIPHNELSTGVHQATLFNKEGKIYAERLFFIYPPHNKINRPAITHLDKNEYFPFDTIKMTIKALRKQPDNISASCSVAVIDGDTEIQTPYSDNLFTYMLLSSDLKGFINQPSFYFEEKDSLHQTALDLLMLTQGWRRYEWKQMAGIEPFYPKFYMEKGLTIAGRILEKDKNKPIQNVSVTITISTEKEYMEKGNMITDSTGCFAFQTLEFEGNRQLSFTVIKNKKLVDCRILLDRSFSPLARPYFYSDKDFTFKRSVETKQYSGSLSEIQLLSDIEVKKNRKQAETFTRFYIYKEMEDSLDKGSKIPESTVSQYLSERIPEIYEKSNSLPIYYLYNRSGRWSKTAPNNRIEHLPLYEINSILVYDSRRAHRNLDIKTKKIPFEDRRTICIYGREIYEPAKPHPGLRQTYLQGYSIVAEFYQPQYNRSIVKGEVDYRRTLYWNPCVKLDKEGEATIRFYNNSTCKHPKVNCEMLSF